MATRIGGYYVIYENGNNGASARPAVKPPLVNHPLLERLDLPRGIRTLTPGELTVLADQTRELIIDITDRNGGHFASPLGVVELTTALLHVFDPARDRIIWDVGHQCHAYKILTDRADRFETIRKKGGLSGYPKRSESPYDWFGTGHSSTSISAALGMAVSRDLGGEDHRVIAVIGDGAMSGGMATEALSNAGELKSNLLVVLNDNGMSISKSVGALSASLSRVLTGGIYNRARGEFRSVMNTFGERVIGAARRLEQGVKDIFVPGAFFEELGFRYVGPVDGHDLNTLVHCFRKLKRFDGPVLFHCVTQKGMGYTDAVRDPLRWHGIKAAEVGSNGSGSPNTVRKASRDTTFTNVFADTLIALAEDDPRIVAVTAAMPTGTGLAAFQQRYPDRFFDVGICEQHAVTFAAGLATEGMKPVVAIYSTFLQRGYDQYIHDVCLQNLPVVFALDRAGLVGEDSPTQQGVFDLSYLRAIPNVQILAPRDDADLRLALKWALGQDGPVALRYARSNAPTIGNAAPRDVPRGEVLREGDDGVFLAVGPVAGACLDAADALGAEGLSMGVADARSVKPLDAALLDAISDRPVITVEENTLEGGFGSAVLEYFEREGRLHDARILRCGVPDSFLEHSTRAEQLEECGLDWRSLAHSARKFFQRINRIATTTIAYR